jgi:Lysyl oxidase
MVVPCARVDRREGVGIVSKQRGIVLFLSFLLAATLFPQTASIAAPTAPRLDLRFASNELHLYRSDRTGVVSLRLPVYLAALDAPFDLRVSRDSYDDPLRIFQAIYDGDVASLTELPAEVLDGWDGLADFFRVRVYSEDDRLLRSVTSSACPAGYEQQRVDDSGPYATTYPFGCRSWDFSLGTVWGIDAGWAVQPLWRSRARVELPAGTYRAVVSITPRYRDLFGITQDAAIAEIPIHVGSFGCDFCGRAPSQVDRERRADEQRRLTAAPTVDDPDPSTLPDLVALPAFSIEVDRRRDREYLVFASNVWNRGPASLVVEGFRQAGEDVMDAYQYFIDDGAIVGRSQVGTFAFDRRDGHHHWHFLQFARYRLLDESLGHVVRSRKQSFCLFATDAVDLTVDGALWREDGFGSTQCGWDESLWIREVLPTGWGDTYFQYVAGQSFEITDLPNGTYFIEVHANPQGLLFDADPSNDTELRELVLAGEPGRRTVTVLPWHGIER